ncbi:MAG: hypothetical protein ACYSW8_27100 [Planctomycetota bacterium]|jgi:hypothetical protein
MIETILAFAPAGTSKILIVVIVETLLTLLAFVLPAVLAMKSFRLRLCNKKENIRLRLEVGRLADELEQLRNQERPEASNS